VLGIFFDTFLTTFCQVLRHAHAFDRLLFFPRVPVSAFNQNKALKKTIFLADPFIIKLPKQAKTSKRLFLAVQTKKTPQLIKVRRRHSVVYSLWIKISNFFSEAC